MPFALSTLRFNINLNLLPSFTSPSRLTSCFPSTIPHQSTPIAPFSRSQEEISPTASMSFPQEERPSTPFPNGGSGGGRGRISHLRISSSIPPTTPAKTTRHSSLPGASLPDTPIHRNNRASEQDLQDGNSQEHLLQQQHSSSSTMTNATDQVSLMPHAGTSMAPAGTQLGPDINAFGQVEMPQENFYSQQTKSLQPERSQSQSQSQSKGPVLSASQESLDGPSNDHANANGSADGGTAVDEKAGKQSRATQLPQQPQEEQTSQQPQAAQPSGSSNPPQELAEQPIDSRLPLEQYGWDDLLARFDAKMSECHAEGEAVWKEWKEWCDVCSSLVPVLSHFSFLTSHPAVL